jgi:hypothetical protein
VPAGSNDRRRGVGRREHALSEHGRPTDPRDREHLRLLRWTMTTGSSGNARAAVVLAAGDHQWEATAEAPGAIGALYEAVDGALEEVLGGRVRLVAFDVHAIGETAGADALVEVTVEPPATATGERAGGRYVGNARHVNLVAAGAEAYLAAIRVLLADEAWAGATEAAGNARLAELRANAERAGGRAELDESQAEDLGGGLFDR